MEEAALKKDCRASGRVEKNCRGAVAAAVGSIPMSSSERVWGKLLPGNCGTAMTEIVRRERRSKWSVDSIGVC